MKTVAQGLVCFVLAWCSAHAGAAPASREPAAVDMIVVHSIGGPKCVSDKVVFDEVRGDAAFWVRHFENETAISIHYVVGRDGQRKSSLPESQVAWHAGNDNNRSIGIELVNRGDGLEVYPPKQITALVNLIRDIRTRYNIPLNSRNVGFREKFKSFRGFSHERPHGVGEDTRNAPQPSCSSDERFQRVRGNR